MPLAAPGAGSVPALGEACGARTALKELICQQPSVSLQGGEPLEGLQFLVQKIKIAANREQIVQLGKITIEVMEHQLGSIDQFRTAQLSPSAGKPFRDLTQHLLHRQLQHEGTVEPVERVLGPLLTEIEDFGSVEAEMAGKGMGVTGQDHESMGPGAGTQLTLGKGEGQRWWQRRGDAQAVDEGDVADTQLRASSMVHPLGSGCPIVFE